MSLEKCLFRSSVHFLIEFSFSDIELYELFMYFGYYQSYHLQLFSPIA